MTKHVCHSNWPTADRLRVGHLNINSALNKMHEVASMLHNFHSPLHIFGLTEARIIEKIPNNDITIPGYTVERRHPQKKT